MQARTTDWRRLGLLALLLAALTRCENTDLQAPGDGTLAVTAYPSTAVVDEDAGRGRSTIRAEVRDVDGVPVESVTVQFTAPSGSLVDNLCKASACTLDAAACTTDADCALPGPSPVTAKTNAKGIAEVPLVVTAGDDESVVVTGASGALSDTAVVFNSLGVQNDPPTAVITVAPATPALNGGPISLDGTGSFDPDGDQITCYQWTVTSSVPIEVPVVACSPASALCTIIQGPFEDLPVLDYFSEQRLTITLRVSEDPAALPCARSGPAVDRSLFSTITDQVNPYVICDNTPPTAVPGNYGPFSLLGDGVNGQVSVGVDGSGSSDAETASNSLTYSWSCGEAGQNPTGRVAVCNYSTVGLKTLRLTVTDGGNGQADCARSHSDTVIVQIDP